jgi:hypothetical protein
MSLTIKWLHLSDFHVGKDAYEQSRLFTQILLEVDRWGLSESFVPDYVFITGDIANNGKKREYETFRKDFLIPLQDKLRDAIFVPVPGNHDVERPSPDLLDRAPPLTASSKFFDPTSQGKTARQQITPRFTHYKKTMTANGTSPDWLVSKEGFVSQIRALAGVDVGVVGLNTAWLCKDDHDKDKLTPGYRLVEAALKKIENCQIRFVLGHHPLSWFDDGEKAKIRRLFTQHHVIYLCGHKHKAKVALEVDGEDNLLVLQAGAAFQAREEDRWVNGFSWGELDVGKSEVRVAPRCWVNGEWPPDMSAIPLKHRIHQTDWWHFPLPGAANRSTAESRALEIPNGWVVLNVATFESFARRITPADAQRFFDGAEPDWALAMSPHFPIRSQAKALHASVISFEGEDRPQIALVRGPTAEGKSMALRQIVVAAVKARPDLQVLWHQDETAGIDAQVFEKTLTTDHRWLIATDHGDMMGQGLVNLAQNLKRSGRGHVQFVMATHESDWKIAKGDSVPWYSFARYEEARLSGLSSEDSTSIATAWQHFKASGQDASLQTLTVAALAARLLEAAKEDGFTDGALFGALLTMRHGRDLRGHVRSLMQKFDKMELSSGGTVGRAFRLIAAMHAEGMDFLSADVMQDVVQCDRKSLQHDVLRPMTAEAAASGSAYLRTRHRRIALAALEVCVEDNEHVDDYYLSLVECATSLVRIRHGWLDAVWNWEYTFPLHFFETERKELAVRITEMMLGIVPDNCHYAVNLATFKRESGNIGGALKVLKAFTPPKDNRTFWTEWGTAAGMNLDYLSNLALHAYSLSDDLSNLQPTVENSKQALSGLALAFEKLNVMPMIQKLHQARAGCAYLGLLTDVGNPKNVAEGILWVRDGIAAALKVQHLDESVAEKVGNPAQFKFDGLQRVLEGIGDLDNHRARRN